MKYYTVGRLELKKTLKSHKGLGLKEQYRNTHTSAQLSIRICSDGSYSEKTDDGWEIYPSMRSSCHRSFSTKQEASEYEINKIEYFREYGIFLRSKRSNKSLPDAWDDLTSFVWSKRNSWKRNSKRSSQYYK